MAQIRAFFPSRVDSWLVAIGPLAALTAATAVAGLAGPFVLNSGGTPPMLALLAVIVALRRLPRLWLVPDTTFSRTEADLVFRSGCVLGARSQPQRQQQ